MLYFKPRDTSEQLVAWHSQRRDEVSACHGHGFSSASMLKIPCTHGPPAAVIRKISKAGSATAGAAASGLSALAPLEDLQVIKDIVPLRPVLAVDGVLALGRPTADTMLQAIFHEEGALLRRDLQNKRGELFVQVGPADPRTRRLVPIHDAHAILYWYKPYADSYHSTKKT